MPELKPLEVKVKLDAEEVALIERLQKDSQLLVFKDSDMSDVALRDALNAALKASVPGYLWIQAVFPDKQIVVYSAEPTGALQIFRQKFKLSEEGTATLSKEREEVKPVTVFEPVVAAADCGCGGSKKEAPAVKEAIVTKAERVKAFLSKPKNPFKAGDTAYLEGLDESRLAELEAHVEELNKPSAKPEPEPAAATQKQLTEEEFLAAAPASIRDMVSRTKKADAEKKNALLAALAEPTKGTYTEEELKVLSIEELQRIANLVKAVPTVAADYSGMGMPRTPKKEKEAVPAPPSMTDALKALQASKN